MTTEPTNEALADNLDNLVAYYDGRGGEHACMGLDDRDNVALAATRLRSQPAPSSEEVRELAIVRKLERAKTLRIGFWITDDEIGEALAALGLAAGKEG